MDERILFFNPSQCSGCGICEMACSLQNAGRCASGDSYIRVLRHPRLGTAVVTVGTRCKRCRQCVNLCTLQAIRFADEAEWGSLLRAGWMACPVLDIGVRELDKAEAV